MEDSHPNGRPEDLIAQLIHYFVQLKPEQIDSGIQESLKLLAGVFEADRCYIFRLSNNGQYLSLTHFWQRFSLSTKRNRSSQSFFLSEFAWWSKQYKHLKVTQISNVAALPESAASEKEFLQTNRIQKLTTVPISAGDTLLGFFGLDSLAECCNWQQDEVVLRQIAGILSMVIERQRLQQGQERSTALMHATMESIATGVIVADLLGEIVDFNQQFIEIWRISEHAITSRRRSQPLIMLLESLNVSKRFLRRVRTLTIQPEAIDYGMLKLKDGRILESFSIPQKLEGIVVGRVWSFRDITAHQKALLALQQSETRFRTLAEMMNVIIFIIQGSQFCYVNPAAEEITGYRREELLEYPDISQIIGNLKQVQQSIDDRSPRYGEIKILTKTGQECWLDYSISTIDFEGSPAILGTAIDTTKRKQAETQILQALEQERELSELRSRFVSMVSHEFRTPLNIISFSNSMLRRYAYQWDREKTNEYFQRIHSAIDQLQQLLDEVLVVYRAELKTLQFKPTLIDLVPYCQDLIASIQMTQSSAPLKFQCAEDTLLACVDDKLLSSILTNLISNAIKYSFAKRLVYFTLFRRDQEVRFEIQDSGIGMTSADQQQLFQPFHRGSNVGTIPGTGLGLTVVKKFVDMHGGNIVINSQLNEGTTVIVCLPLILNPDQRPTELSPPSINLHSGEIKTLH